MKRRRHGLFASTAVVLLTALSLTACGAGSSGDPSSDSSSSSAPGTVVTHVMEPKPVDPHILFQSGPAGSGPIPSGTPVNGQNKAQPFDGIPKVGAVFFSVGGVVSAHYCTGSVVHSASGNLIATAAHCVYNELFAGWQDHVVFVPGYHDDIAPYGAWVATTAYLNSKWVSKQDPDADVAFLTVRKVGGGSQSLESITGASTFTSNPGYPNQVSVAAYPLGKSQPVGCHGTTKKFTDHQLELDCAGLPDGASGSPFLASGDRLVGVLGGFEQGGNTPDTSYSIYFTDRIAAIFKAASGS